MSHMYKVVDFEEILDDKKVGKLLDELCIQYEYMFLVDEITGRNYVSYDIQTKEVYETNLINFISGFLCSLETIYENSEDNQEIYNQIVLLREYCLNTFKRVFINHFDK